MIINEIMKYFFICILISILQTKKAMACSVNWETKVRCITRVRVITGCGKYRIARRMNRSGAFMF